VMRQKLLNFHRRPHPSAKVSTHCCKRSVESF
jgi:hypothetical protein